jgi:hypothetical protein
MKIPAIGLAITQLLTAIVMVIAAVESIESIVVTGPIFALVGLLLALVTRALQSWAVLAFALSAPLVGALVSFMIALFELGPAEARTPTLVTLTIYLFLVSPAALVTFLRLICWNTIVPSRHSSGLRFSVKTLLLLMTGTAIVIAGGKLLFDTARLDEQLVFGGYTFVALVLSAATLWWFLAGRTAPNVGDEPRVTT